MVKICKLGYEFSRSIKCGSQLAEKRLASQDRLRSKD